MKKAGLGDKGHLVKSVSGVSGYVRRNGQAVRSHIRKTLRKQNTTEIVKTNLQSLLVEESVGSIETPSQAKEQYWDTSLQAKHREEVTNFKQKNRSSMIDSAAFTSISTLFFSGLIFVGTGSMVIAIAGILGAIAVITVPFWGNKILTKLKQKREQNKFNKASKNFSQSPDKNTLRKLSESFPWKRDTTKYGHQSLKEKLFGIKNYHKDDLIEKTVVSTSRINKNGIGWTKIEKNDSETIFKEHRWELYPKAKLAGIELRYFYAKGANLAEAEFENTTFSKTNLDGANLTGANFSYANFFGGQLSSAKGAKLVNANLNRSDWRRVDLTGADLTGANVTDAFLPSDLSKFKISKEQFDTLSHFFTDSYVYPKLNFSEAIESLQLSETQFEFLVLSGVIEVRDNITLKVVEKGFDPEKHHITMWDIEEYKKTHQK